MRSLKQIELELENLYEHEKLVIVHDARELQPENFWTKYSEILRVCIRALQVLSVILKIKKGWRFAILILLEYLKGIADKNGIEYHKKKL